MRLVVTLALTLLAAAAEAQVLITEVQPDPVGADNSEWIELHNVGTASVSIAGWAINDWVGSSDAGREATTRWRFPPGAAIAAGEVIVVARNARTDGFFELFGRDPSYECADATDEASVPNMLPMGGTSPITLPTAAAATRSCCATRWGPSSTAWSGGASIARSAARRFPAPPAPASR